MATRFEKSMLGQYAHRERPYCRTRSCGVDDGRKKAEVCFRAQRGWEMVSIVKRAGVSIKTPPTIRSLQGGR